MSMLDFFSPKSIYDVLHAFNSVQQEMPESQRDVLVSGFFDWLSDKDEIAFMAEMAKLPDEGRQRILDWFKKIDQQTAYLFRKFITTDPEEGRRQDTLLSYAKVEDHDERTKRFELESIPHWFVSDIRKLRKSIFKKIKKLIKDHKNFFSVEGIKRLKELIDEKELKKCLDDQAVKLVPHINKATEKITKWVAKRKARHWFWKLLWP